jgi:hypothetical protein
MSEKNNSADYITLLLKPKSDAPADTLASLKSFLNSVGGVVLIETESPPALIGRISAANEKAFSSFPFVDAQPVTIRTRPILRLKLSAGKDAKQYKYISKDNQIVRVKLKG